VSPIAVHSLCPSCESPLVSLRRFNVVLSMDDREVIVTKKRLRSIYL